MKDLKSGLVGAIRFGTVFSGKPEYTMLLVPPTALQKWVSFKTLVSTAGAKTIYHHYILKEQLPQWLNGIPPIWKLLIINWVRPPFSPRHS